MLDPNKEYRTKNNNLIRIYATDGGPSKEEIHGAIKYTHGWKITFWFNEQEFFNEGNKEYNPLAKLKAGDPIIVWGDDTPGIKFLRVFVRSTHDDHPVVYVNGRIQDEVTVIYDNFELLPNYNYGG